MLPPLKITMLETLHKIYEADETFLDFLAHDLDEGAVWFNNSEFARYHDINGKKILSVFTSDMRSKSVNIKLNTEQNPEGVAKAGGVLFVRRRDIKGVARADSTLRLDGELYTISEARLIQDQIWRITLEANK